jgi:hypothetical protein
MLANHNLPALAKQFNVSLLIHCDDATKKIIMQSDAYQPLLMHAKITFCIFPKTLMKLYELKSRKISSVFPQIRYLLLGVCQTHAFKVALQYRAYLSYMMPDVVLSDSFFQSAFSHIGNKKLVLTTTYRSHFHAACPHLDEIYQQGLPGQLTISAMKLLALQIDHIHPYEKKRIVSTKTMNFSPSARLIFNHKNGFIFRCFHYHPTIINCANIHRPVGLDYLPIDNTALNDIFDPNLPYEDQAWVCTNPAEMAIMELSDEAPEMEVILNTATLSYEQLVSQVRDLLINAATIFNTPFNQFLASFRHVFIVPGYENKLALDDDIIDDNQFFYDVRYPMQDKKIA